MCGPAALPIAMIAGSVLAAGASIYSADKQASAQKAAMKQAGVQAEKQAADEKASNERAINAANQKRSDFATMFAMNSAAGANGVGSTMLTGTGGASTANTMLGRSTLLGA